MKRNGIAALAIIGSLVLLALPIIGVAILCKYIGHNEPIIAGYLLLLAPVSWLVWGVCKERRLHETDNKVLRGLSWLNTALVVVFLSWFVLWLTRSCQHSLYIDPDRL